LIVSESTKENKRVAIKTLKTSSKMSWDKKKCVQSKHEPKWHNLKKCKLAKTKIVKRIEGDLNAPKWTAKWKWHFQTWLKYLIAPIYEESYLLWTF
jgi:hypothetical protein